MFPIVCLLLLSHSLLAAAHDKACGPKSIFILGGQSNMAGRGNVIGGRVINTPGSEPNPQVLRFTAAGEWEEAHDPLHIDIDLGKPCGVGPGMAFANAVVQRNPAVGVVGLVPCAIGGTIVSKWLPGQTLYNDMLSRTRAALRAGGGKIEALLWYQGESDTVAKANADAYKNNTARVFTQLRADLQMPDLPVIMVALASVDETGVYFDQIRKDQLEMSSLVPNVKCVDALGSEVMFDHLHLTGAAEVKVGKMLAAAYLG